MESIVYNVKKKTFPDGTIQYTFYELARERGYEENRKKKKKGIGDPKKNKQDAAKRATQMVFEYARCNSFDWFITLTFDPEKVNSFDYDECVECIKKFTQRLRDRGIRYILVPELHESGRYHFHGLLHGNLPVREAKNHYTGELLLDAQGRQVYNIDIYKDGFTTAMKCDGHARVASYLAKYITKADCVPAGRKSYWVSRGLVLPNEEFYEVSAEEYGEVFNRADFTKVIDGGDYGKFIMCEIHGEGGRESQKLIYGEVNKMKTISPSGQ